MPRAVKLYFYYLYYYIIIHRINFVYDINLIVFTLFIDQIDREFDHNIMRLPQWQAITARVKESVLLSTSIEMNKNICTQLTGEILSALKKRTIAFVESPALSINMRASSPSDCDPVGSLYIIIKIK